jgi:hypothetical protein
MGQGYNDDIVGILLVENGGIVGAAGFIDEKEYVTLNGVEYVNVTKEHWRWVFAFFDPHHHRKGYLTKRIPEWKTMFGEFTSNRA